MQDIHVVPFTSVTSIRIVRASMFPVEVGVCSSSRFEPLDMSTGLPSLSEVPSPIARKGERTTCPLFVHVNLRMLLFGKTS